MTPTAFENLLGMVSFQLQKVDVKREPISTEVRLAITLRYLAIGDSMRSLSYLFRVGFSTVSTIIAETIKIIWEVLQPIVLQPPTEEEWLNIASGAGEEDSYKPIWIFYDAMEVFLRNVYESRSIMNSEENAESHSQQEGVVDDEVCRDGESSTSVMQTDNNRSEAENSTPSASSENSNLSSNSKQVHKRRARNPPELQEASKHMTTAFTTLNNLLQTTKNQNEDNNKNEDECDLFCKLMAKKLREYSKAEQEDIMYEIHGLMINKRRCRDRNIQPTSTSFNRPTSSLSFYSQSPSPDLVTNGPCSPKALSQNLVHHQMSSKSRRVDMQPTFLLSFSFPNFNHSTFIVMLILVTNAFTKCQ
ncbi:hypothetical protein NQ314_016792 [Rhamnusium bicolor]|uniref:Uncharacterized protein n=1 Tax=Rhamnusium bicolor TaxID=1586634 RepID=A0AAV8WVX7_9CUCU|nr:hypothetical protein NQ314_016792 [Rhamnusium bicolor]